MKIGTTTRRASVAWLLAGLGLVACGEGDGASDAGVDAGDGSALDGMVSEGGVDGGGDAAAPGFEVEVSRNPDNPLSAFVDVRGDVPVRVEIEVAGPGLERSVVGPETPASSQDLGVWGMRAESTYDLTVHAFTEDGTELSPIETSYETPALPDDFPPMAVTGEPTAGYTMFNVFRWNPSNDPDWGLLLIVDAEGEVVWFHRDTPGPGDARLLDNGHILYAADNEKLVEIDMMGRTVLERTAAEIGTDTVHHEVYPLPEGDHLAFLSSELHADVAGYMDMDDNPISEDVVSDVVVEIDGEGAIVHAYDLFDVLDPLRITGSFYSPFWSSRYGNDSDAPRDWTHGNAVIFDEADDSFILSLRHQDWLVKIDRASGDLIWTFGEEGDFTLQGAGSFQSHQHAPEILADGRILLYDNGNAVEQSRAVIYDLDETAMTATQDWEHSDGSFAPFVGDADMLDSGNVLVTHGGLVADPSLPLADPANLKSARLLEVTADADKEVVWQLDIEDDAEADPVGYTIYRAERLADLYP